MTRCVREVLDLDRLSIIQDHTHAAVLAGRLELRPREATEGACLLRLNLFETEYSTTETRVHQLLWLTPPLVSFRRPVASRGSHTPLAALPPKAVGRP